jgi:hypothetical protein
VLSDLNSTGSIARRKCCVNQLTDIESCVERRPEGALRTEPVDRNGTIGREVIDGRYDAGFIGSHHELWFALFKIQEEDH